MARAPWLLAAVTAVALLPAAARPAAADDAYELAGEAEGRAWRGVVVVRAGAGDEVAVRHVRRFDADLRIEVLAGAGRRRGGVVEAEVRPEAGAAEAVDRLGAPGAAGPALRLELEVAGAGADARWRLRLRDGERTVATGAGRVAGLPELSGPARRWQRFEGVPFVQGVGEPHEVHVSDPRQGQLGDCYLISGMIALARTEAGRARLWAMIQPGPQPGEWVVSLRGEGQFLIRKDERTEERVDPRLNYDARVVVDGRLPVDGGGGLVFCGPADQRVEGGVVLHELWPQMIERAYAQSAGSYAAIASGWPGDVFRLAGGTIRRHKAAAMTEAELDAVLREALRDGHAIAVSSGVDVGAAGDRLNVVADHSYALLEARFGGFVLYNPWGSSHPTRALTAADLKALGSTIEVCDLR